jgi:serine/threonine protein kinase
MKQDQVERFQKEMQTTARLKHDHIVAIHDTGEHFGLPFYTMDFVDTSLAQKLRHGPLEPRLAAELVAKAARGVHHAHGQGIIHRDIKPHNILLDRDKPLLADLGLAAAMEALQGKGGGEIAGTAAYMAPEQARGGSVDARTDVYGLGATLYHLVTSRPPHQASERKQILDEVISAEPVPPRQLNPAVDRNLEAIILKSLEKLPERRYATAGLLADDLDRFLNGYTVAAKIPSMFERVQKWARREPIKAILASSIVGLVGLLFLMLGVLYLVQTIGNRQLRAALDDTKAAKETAEKHRDEAEEARSKADLERDRATAEQKKTSALASILGMRVLNKMKPQEDPLRAIKNKREQIEVESRQLQTADEVAAPSLKLDLAENYRALANLLMLTSPKQSLPDAIKYLEECVQLQQDVGKTIPILKVDLGLNYIELAGYYALAGALDKELETDQKALAVLQDVRKQVSDEPTIRAAIGEAHLMLGIDYVKRGQKKIALGHQKDAVQLLDELVATAGADSVAGHAYQQKLGRAYQQLANNLDL